MQALRTRKYSISKQALKKKIGKRNMGTAPKPEQIIYKESALHRRIWKQDLFIMTFNKSVL